MRRYLAPAGLGGIALLGVVWAAGLVADHLGSRIGRALGEMAAAVPGEAVRSAVAADGTVAAEEGVNKPRPAVTVRPQAETWEKRPMKAGGRSRIPQRGIRVAASTVLRLANAGLCPSGAPVQAVGGRPAGLVLSGVSGLGIGMQDGDVLTRAAGRPALSPGDVVGVVLASRGAGAPEISGQFWRDGEPWQLTVEQPYLAPPRTPPDPPQPEVEDEPDQQVAAPEPASEEQQARSPVRRHRGRG